jgi:hypothetical protein
MSRKAKVEPEGEKRAEYDFSQGIRGKYLKRYKSGPVTVVIKRVGSPDRNPEKPDASRSARVREREQAQRDGYARKPVRRGEFDA